MRDREARGEKGNAENTLTQLMEIEEAYERVINAHHTNLLKYTFEY